MAGIWRCAAINPNVANFQIYNNVFYDTNAGLSYITFSGNSWAPGLTIDYNLYYYSGWPYAWNWIYPSAQYTNQDYATYRQYTGQDAHSILAEAQFVDPANRDFHLLSTSPAVNTGTNTGVAADYDGISPAARPRVRHGRLRIHLPPPTVTGVLVASSVWSSGFLSSVGGVGYAIPAGPDQLRPLPGSNLNEVIVQFNEDVNVRESDLVLSGVNVPTYGFSAFSYNAVNHRATWTLSQSLSRDELLVDLDGSTANAVADALGNRLGRQLGEPDVEPAVGAQRGRAGRRATARRAATSNSGSTSCRATSARTARWTCRTWPSWRPIIGRATPAGPTAISIVTAWWTWRTWPFWRRTTDTHFRWASRSAHASPRSGRGPGVGRRRHRWPAKQRKHL